MNKKKLVPELPRNNISIGFIEGFCNLNCPKCLVHGKNKKGRKTIKGTMSLKRARALFDELKDSGILVNASGYSEPFLQKNFLEYVKAMKTRGIKVSINTNGLLLTEKTAQRLMGLKVDCVFVSIDAVTKDTLKKVRATDELEKINKAVFFMLKARGEKTYPRIGVSFVVEEGNAHEKEAFINFWIEHVDAVRIARLYSECDAVDHELSLRDRKPCSILYDTMLIHNNGDVPLCCFDGNGETKVGNVFENGIKGVWSGERFRKIRHYHETGRFDKVPFCAKCRDWARYELVKEEKKDNILVRYFPLLTYYNRVDRLSTWRFRRTM